MENPAQLDDSGILDTPIRHYARVYSSHDHTQLEFEHESRDSHGVTRPLPRTNFVHCIDPCISFESIAVSLNMK